VPVPLVVRHRGVGLVVVDAEMSPTRRAPATSICSVSVSRTGLLPDSASFTRTPARCAE
jgi:hypothetical protein